MKNAMAVAIAFSVSTVICYEAVSVFRTLAEKRTLRPNHLADSFMYPFYHFSTILLLTFNRIKLRLLCVYRIKCYFKRF